MIELQSVSKKFGATIALHETDLSIEAGKTTVLIGASGCGKSTILRLIIGLLEPTTGTVRIEGERVSTVLATLRRATARRSNMMDDAETARRNRRSARAAALVDVRRNQKARRAKETHPRLGRAERARAAFVRQSPR